MSKKQAEITWFDALKIVDDANLSHQRDDVRRAWAVLRPTLHPNIWGLPPHDDDQARGERPLLAHHFSGDRAQERLWWRLAVAVEQVYQILDEMRPVGSEMTYVRTDWAEQLGPIVNGADKDAGS